MANPFLLRLAFTFYLVIFTSVVSCDDYSDRQGHLKPLGLAGSISDIEYYGGFPSLQTFFKEYYYKSKPLVMKGAAKLSPAYNLWSDDYFQSIPDISDSKVAIEQPKDKSLALNVTSGTFKEFLSRYKTTREYLVDKVPSFLRKDVYMPACISCDAIDYIEDILWFSNGGTKSTLHTDSMENLNCLFRGSKDLILFDKSYPEKDIIDVELGHYSSVDVDRVDLNKFPVLADVQYLKAHMEPGDCLYIPYLWYHQVRSFNYNLAVNVWFKHYDQPINLSSCNSKPNRNVPLDQFQFIGMNNYDASLGNTEVVEEEYEVREDEMPQENSFADFFLDSLGDKDEIGLDAFITYMRKETARLTSINDEKRYKEVAKISSKIFKKLDKNGDNQLSLEEIDNISSQDDEEIGKMASNLITDNDAKQILKDGKSKDDPIISKPDGENQVNNDHLQGHEEL
ncbi:Lysine-specific demethylase 8 [Trichoplax sp. H2]|nr:Lysine-specific demethylase 8 [Trichoplax sp. H2]|eukprot:RDD43630.1 Lysine-specific demethylase 8 [Trichoplax sp. H2]